MNLPDEIRTIDDFKEVSLVIKKSNFIAQIYPVFSEKVFKEILTKAKKKYFNASHHCYAYKLTDGSVRYSDAGEPNGTAGVRILNAIEHFNLSNQLIIVSRIFGGIKLGVGPLGKAYYESASKVIVESEIKSKQLFVKATISSSFDQINSIHKILSNSKSIITETTYFESVQMGCLLKSSEMDLISKKISEMGKGSISITFSDETVYR
jgi:uncharacterized YigZ family protein